MMTILPVMMLSHQFSISHHKFHGHLLELHLPVGIKKRSYEIQCRYRTEQKKKRNNNEFSSIWVQNDSLKHSIARFKLHLAKQCSWGRGAVTGLRWLQMALKEEMTADKSNKDNIRGIWRRSVQLQRVMFKGNSVGSVTAGSDVRLTSSPSRC